MGLPWMKPKTIAGLIMNVRKPDGSQETTGSTENPDAGLQAASADLIRAVMAKDEAGVCAALRAAFTILDAEPHEEAKDENVSG